jgi:hypothetical protein
LALLLDKSNLGANMLKTKCAEKEVMWQEFADMFGGQFKSGPEVLVNYKNWTIKLWREDESTSVGDSDNNMVLAVKPAYTYAKAIFVARKNFHFRISSSTTDKLGKYLRIVKHVHIDDEAFEHKFTVSASDALVANELLTSNLRDLLVTALKGKIFTANNESWSGPYYPKSCKMLQIRQDGLITTKEELEALFLTIAGTLDRLVEIEAAWDDDPTDLIGKKPAWRAIIKGFVGSLVLGIPFGILFGIGFNLLAKGRAHDFSLSLIVGVCFSIFLFIPIGLITPLIFWISKGKYFGGIFGSGIPRRFACPKNEHKS